MTPPRYPLQGITVLDLGQVYQGPYCGFLMAMGGARVIKIEPPHGDSVRSRADAPGGNSLAFSMLNSNKEGMVLDLKTDAGREIFLRLVDHADVVIDNCGINGDAALQIAGLPTAVGSTSSLTGIFIINLIIKY